MLTVTVYLPECLDTKRKDGTSEMRMLRRGAGILLFEKNTVHHASERKLKFSFRRPLCEYSTHSKPSGMRP